MGDNEPQEVLSIPLLGAGERDRFAALTFKLKRMFRDLEEFPRALDGMERNDMIRSLGLLDEVIYGLDRWMEDHLSAAFRARDLAGENERLRASSSALSEALRGWHELDDGHTPERVSREQPLISRAERDRAGSILFNADDANRIAEWSRERFAEALDDLEAEIRGQSALAFRFARHALQAYARIAPDEPASNLVNDFDTLAEIVEEVRTDAHRRLEAEQGDSAEP